MRLLPVALIPVFALAVPLGAALSAKPHDHAAPVSVTVYKNAQCGCCRSWVDHLRKEGFKVTAKDVDDLAAIKKKLGVPTSLHLVPYGRRRALRGRRPRPRWGYP